ncbi:MAG: hypothetical protein ABI454_00770 [Sphingomicrobium sp.]
MENYDFYEFRRFLISLRRTRFRGHVCLFVGPGISRRTIAKIRKHDVEVVPYGGAFPFVGDPHSDAPKSLPEPIYVFNYRHFLYYDYLLKHGTRFRSVLLTDVKDVVFQGDPFEFALGDRIHVAMENPDIPVGSCPWTSQWILAGYPPEVLDRLKDEEMSCAGTTLAPVPRMMRYLKLMLAEISRMTDAYECADQAAHNLLLHEGKLEPANRLRNFEGPILTVGTEPRYQLNGDKELVNRDGSVIAVVHQFDRHAELVRIYEEKAVPGASRRWASKAAFRLKGRVRSLLRRAREGWKSSGTRRKA